MCISCIKYNGWNVNAGLRTEIDLSECEHFLKAYLNQFQIVVSLNAPVNVSIGPPTSAG